MRESSPPAAAAVATTSGSTAARFAWPVAFVVVVGMTLLFLRDRSEHAHHAGEGVEITHSGTTVVSDLRALARMETLALHLEKVIEVQDHQERLRGLVTADDRVLFVASGEVILGVDLAKLRDDDARFDPATGTAYVTLPEPEILSSRFDEARSYVHARSTDLLAQRNEGLESAARRDAIAAFEKAGRDPANVAKAREHAETAIRSLAARWGASRVIVTWQADGPSQPTARIPE